MRAVGSPAAGWVASSTAEYVDMATEAASSLQRLAEMRKQLRPALLASRLCDGPTFVSQLEAAYADMWQQQRQQGLSVACQKT